MSCLLNLILFSPLSDHGLLFPADNAPEWSKPVSTDTVRIGKGFVGWIDEVKLYKLNAARGYYNSFVGDRNGDGIDEGNGTKAFLSMESQSSVLDMYNGTHSFLPCLFEDMKQQTHWFGMNDFGNYSKEVSCPYCVSCRVLKAQKYWYIHAS